MLSQVSVVAERPGAGELEPRGVPLLRLLPSDVPWLRGFDRPGCGQVLAVGDLGPGEDGSERFRAIPLLPGRRRQARYRNARRSHLSGQRIGVGTGNCLATGASVPFYPGSAPSWSRGRLATFRV